MTFSAKKRFFEKEIEQTTVQPAAKPERRFSFLSEDEVNKLRQEEERKIAALTDEQFRTLSRLDEAVDEDEDDGDDDDDDDEDQPPPPLPSSHVPVLPQTPTIVRTAKAEKRLKDKLVREVVVLSFFFNFGHHLLN